MLKVSKDKLEKLSKTPVFEPYEKNSFLWSVSQTLGASHLSRQAGRTKRFRRASTARARDGRAHDDAVDGLADVARRVVSSLTTLTARRDPPLERAAAAPKIFATAKPAPPRRALALASLTA